MIFRFDTSKFILEHYVDGDLVNSETPVTKDVASPDGLYIWGESVHTHSCVEEKEEANICLRLGPDLPPRFMD